MHREVPRWCVQERWARFALHRWAANPSKEWKTDARLQACRRDSNKETRSFLAPLTDDDAVSDAETRVSDGLASCAEGWRWRGGWAVTAKERDEQNGAQKSARSTQRYSKFSHRNLGTGPLFSSERRAVWADRLKAYTEFCCSARYLTYLSIHQCAA
jgi:hypothetical protein